MTEVSKPGDHCKIASVFCFPPRKLVLVINTVLDFYAYFRNPQQLENWSEYAQILQEATKKLKAEEGKL